MNIIVNIGGDLKKDIKKQIEWYLDFACRDLDTITKSDSVKLIVDARELIFRGLTGIRVTEIEKTNILGVPIGQEAIFNLDWLRELQHSFLTVFNSMTDKIEHLSDHEERTWKKYRDSKTVGGVVVSPTFNIGFNIEAKIVGPFEYDQKDDKTKIRWSRDWVEQSGFTIETHPTCDDSTMFIYGFLKCLPGIPTNAFKRCEECENWYFHLSRRKRQFCNNRCAAKHANRVRREKQKKGKPEEYAAESEKSRKRARKSYVEKIKKVHPKAQVRRYSKKSN
jgi:hypothetical protein